MVRAEIAERKAVEMPAMRRIAKGAEIRIVRRDDQDPARCGGDPVELLHRADDIRNVLDDVHHAHGIERAIAKRIREAVEVTDDVGTRMNVAIDADGPGILVDTAAYVEN